eukprot:768541-Hanusia_phi.AAC.2
MTWVSSSFSKTEKDLSGDRSAWTDTPAEKARKEREKQMGLDTGRKRKEAAEEEIETTSRAAAIIEQYNATVRAESQEVQDTCVGVTCLWNRSDLLLQLGRETTSSWGAGTGAALVRRKSETPRCEEEKKI